MFPQLRMREGDVEASFLRWMLPGQTLPVMLDRNLPGLEDAADAYAVEAIRAIVASRSGTALTVFPLCAGLAEVCVIITGENSFAGVRRKPT